MLEGKSLAVGVLSGLVLASILVFAVSISAGGAVHLDLAPVRSGAPPSNGAGQQGVQTGTGVVAPQTGGQSLTTTSSQAQQTSSVREVLTGGGTEIGVVVLPVLLGAVLGAIFYGVYGRTVDRE